MIEYLQESLLRMFYAFSFFLFLCHHWQKQNFLNVNILNFYFLFGDNVYQVQYFLQSPLPSILRHNASKSSQQFKETRLLTAQRERERERGPLLYHFY